MMKKTKELNMMMTRREMKGRTMMARKKRKARQQNNEVLFLPACVFNIL